MTLIIENVKEEFLPAFRGLARGAKAKIVKSKERYSIPTDETREALLNPDNLSKSYNSLDEFLKEVKSEIEAEAN